LIPVGFPREGLAALERAPVNVTERDLVPHAFLTINRDELSVREMQRFDKPNSQRFGSTPAISGQPLKKLLLCS